MAGVVDELISCIDRGKVDINSPYPPDLKGKEGADEIAKKALASGERPEAIFKACDEGMRLVGERFGKGQAFVPELLMAAKAMKAVMAHLKPYFAAGTVKPKGTFVIGTVAGDLHDIGKNLVAMVVEGGGWKVVDLGVDVKSAKFLDAVQANPGCLVGLSALLTTTMVNMESTIKDIKSKFPETKVIVGGAPLTMDAANRMGADGYGKNPQEAAAALDALAGA